MNTHGTLTSAPRGYPAGHPRIDLLRMKDIFAGRAFPASPWLSTRGADMRVKRAIADVTPLRDWIARHAGSRQGP